MFRLQFLFLKGLNRIIWWFREQFRASGNECHNCRLQQSIFVLLFANVCGNLTAAFKPVENQSVRPVVYPCNCKWGHESPVSCACFLQILSSLRSSVFDLKSGPGRIITFLTRFRQRRQMSSIDWLVITIIIQVTSSDPTPHPSASAERRIFLIYPSLAGYINMFKIRFRLRLPLASWVG